MLENPYYHDEDAREERRHLRVWVGRILALVFALVFIAWATKAYAAPIAQAQSGDSVVVLHDEDCKLDLKNLKKRAVWVEKGKSYEGCWGQHPAFPIVVIYFDDKSVVVILTESFERMKGA